MIEKFLRFFVSREPPEKQLGEAQIWEKSSATSGGQSGGVREQFFGSTEESLHVGEIFLVPTQVLIFQFE